MKFIKLKSAEQPTTPKPTTTLPNNMTWAWDPKANQWIAVMKDNPVVTPPTYNPNNVNNLNNTTTTQMYTPVKATKIKKVKAEELTKCEWCGEEYEDSELEDTELGKICHRCKLGIESKEGPLHKKSTLIDSLNQFLDGDKYSKEIKIEKGLISNGLIKLAGINPIRGPKYSITDKGLNLLKQAAQEEYDFEKDYIKARKSYLLDGISESEFKTGAPEEQGQMPKFSIFEKDGSELAQIEAKNSTDAKVKFFMENPEYEGSQSICIKEVKAELEFNGSFEYNNYKIDLFNDTDGGATFVIYAPKGKTVNNESMYKGTASTIDEAITKAYNIIDGKKEIDSAYGETTNENLSYPNQSVSPSSDVKVDPKGWVNMAGLKIKATKITPKLLQLGGVLSKYLNSIQLSNDDENILIISGDARLINDIEHEVRDIGLYCDAIDVTPDNSDRTYSLRIFLE